MTAINHALTGTAIGLIVGQPILALPLAVASHFMCDALPHFGVNLPDPILFKSKLHKPYLITEAIVCFLIVILLFVVKPDHWLLAGFCAFLAAAPDLISINRYLTVKAGKKWQPGIYTKFASDIQWFERPIGAVVEAAWLIAAIVVIIPFIVR